MTAKALDIEQKAKEIEKTFDPKFNKRERVEWIVQVYAGAFLEGLELGVRHMKGDDD